MLTSSQTDEGGPLTSYLEPYVSALADHFYPQRCVGCDRRASDVLCREYFEALPRVGRPTCARCGMPTAFETFVCERVQGCGLRLRERQSTPEVHRRREGDRPHPQARRLHQGRGEAGRAAYARGHRRHRARFDAVVPVPMHRSRLWRRGFNQAELLAHAVAGKIKRTCFRYTTSRAQDTRSGRALGRREESERRGRVQGQGRRPGKSSPDRRRLHDRSDDERVRRDPPWGPARERCTPRACAERASHQLSTFRFC